MQTFGEYVSKPRQNLHMTHIDEALFEGGDEAAQKSLDALHSILENDGSYKLTVKWDGAPAVFCGTDPADGKFFVGTKSVFNKNPKLYKEANDIIANEPSGKAAKLVEALRLLPKLGIPKDTVLQGDLLWTNGDHIYETFNGQRYVTVHPNTLVYGWLAESDEGKRVRAAELGIVFHTTYRGRNQLSNYSATFGVNTDNLNVIPEVWFDNAYFKGKEIAICPTKTQMVNEILATAKSRVGSLDKIVEIMNTIPSNAAGANIKSFYNSYIREGVYPTVDKAYEQYIDYIKSYWDKQLIAKLKTEQSISRKRLQCAQLRSDITMNRHVFEQAFNYVNEVRAIRNTVIAALNDSSTQKIFYKDNNGLHETTHEGYVAINVKTGDAVKLVDRISFSYMNFNENVKKGWQK